MDVVNPAGDVIHSTVVNGLGLSIMRQRYAGTEYRLRIGPAPEWEEVDRWKELADRLR